tara:strand:- start:424 stop:648 length:225 start_codon:yes stop_codon:yes gene_type:complete
MNEKNTEGNALMEEWLKLDERRKMAKHHMIKLQQIYDTVNASLLNAKVEYEEYKSRQKMIGHSMDLHRKNNGDN